jgi:uncharacterized protein (TIGR02246 family)
MASPIPDTWEDERELHQLVLRYARACDTHDAAEFAAIFTEYAAIVSPRHTMTGRDQIVAVVPTALKAMYLKTMHLVHNDMAWIDGDEARGETYCIAHHLTPAEDGKASDYIMAITYANKFRKVDGRWQFAHRHLTLNWSETKLVDLTG